MAGKLIHRFVHLMWNPAGLVLPQLPFPLRPILRVNAIKPVVVNLNERYCRVTLCLKAHQEEYTLPAMVCLSIDFCLLSSGVMLWFVKSLLQKICGSAVVQFNLNTRGSHIRFFGYKPN